MNGFTCSLNDDNHTPESAAAWRKATIAAVVFLILLQVVFFTGVASSDDLAYLKPAAFARSGQAITPEVVDQFNGHCFARIVHWKSVQLAITLLPHAPWAMALPAMLACLVTMLMVHRFASRHFGPAAGFFATVLFGAIPTVICCSSVALPDLPAAALAWIGMYFAAGLILQQDVSHARLRGLAAGFIFGLAYNAKEPAVLLVGGLAAFVLISRRDCRWAWERLVLIGAGFGCWLAVETLILWRWTGNPSFHTYWIAQAHRGYEAPPIAPGIRGFLVYATDYLRWLADPRSEFSLIGPVLLVGTAAALFSGRQVVRLLSLSIVSFLLYASIGTHEFARYSPLIHQPRYLVPLLPAMALVTAPFIAWCWHRSKLGRAVVVCGMGIALLGSVHASNQMASRLYHAPTFFAGYELIQTHVATASPKPRVVGSVITRNRFQGVPYWTDLPPMEMVRPGPSTPEEWVERYGGCYVLATRVDRYPCVKAKQVLSTLHGASYAALSTFELIDRVEPQRDRLASIKAVILSQRAPTLPQHAVELWRVPEPTEWTQHTRHDLAMRSGD